MNGITVNSTKIITNGLNIANANPCSRRFARFRSAIISSPFPIKYFSIPAPLINRRPTKLCWNYTRFVLCG